MSLEKKVQTQNTGLSVHLLSLPWSDPSFPCIQTSALKAHLDSVFQGNPRVYTHSPFFSIPYQMSGENFWASFEDCSQFMEIPYLALFYKSFGLPGLNSNMEMGLLLNEAKSRFSEDKLDDKTLEHLECATLDCLQTEFAPFAGSKTPVVVGFTINYSQVYSSLFSARTLINMFPDTNFKFIFGGASAGVSEVIELIFSLLKDSVVVVGEGEKPLEELIHFFMSEMDGVEFFPDISGVLFLNTYRSVAEIPRFDQAPEENQKQSINTLSRPDFTEYFQMLDALIVNSTQKIEFLKKTWLQVEGSRGCFAKCNFCGVPFNWRGFRKRDAESIFRETIEQAEKYNFRRVAFTDNVCDTWAEDYAERILKQGLSIECFMELRAHHSEIFWTKVALAGMRYTQVGIESFSSSLLKKMEKGTNLIQNLRMYKWLTELDVNLASNLITHHPHSTKEDVRETIRILEKIPHMRPLAINKYVLSPGSPIFQSLSLQEQKKLKLRRSTLGITSPFRNWVIDFCYELPEKMELKSEVQSEWNFFQAWHSSYRKNQIEEKPSLRVKSLENGEDLIIKSFRNPEFKEKQIHLGVEQAQVYRACHAGLQISDLEKFLGFPERRIQEILGGFIREDLMIEVESHFLSLALRSKRELIENLIKAEPQFSKWVSQPSDF